MAGGAGRRPPEVPGDAPTGQVARVGTIDGQLLDLVEQARRVAPRPIPLVDERQQQEVPLAADLEEASRVCGSVPFAASSTITAASAAANTR